MPEWVIRANNWQFLISAMPDNFTEQERDRYRKAWAQAEAMTSMINWYRALLRQPPKSTAAAQIRVPTLVLWGQQDPHISFEIASPNIDLCETGRLVVKVTFEDATHWVMHDKPKEVSQLLIEHFHRAGDFLSDTN